jgi:hypothetical protein
LINNQLHEKANITRKLHGFCPIFTPQIPVLVEFVNMHYACWELEQFSPTTFATESRKIKSE